MQPQARARAFRSAVRGRTARVQARRRWRSRRRGVSDVVATILILALTVVLFASLFAFVSRFPAPPAQSVNQFQASVVSTATNSSGTYCGATKIASVSAPAVCSLSILQDGGPPVPTADRVYLQSSRSTTNWQFSAASGVPVGWGIGNATGGWVTGQYWTETFATPIKNPANITIYIVSSSQLLYSGVVPGSTPNVPPVLTSAYTVPSTPAVGAAFQIFAFVSGNPTNLTLNISLSEIPGLPTAVQAMKPYGTGEWVYNVSAALTTKNGSYLAFIQGVNTTGSTIAGTVSVTLTSSGGGPIYTVTVGVSPQTPPVPQNSTLTPTFFLSATINYTGAKSNVAVWVNFTVAQSPGGKSPKVATSTALGQTGLTVTGPGTVVVYSQKGFGGWILNSSVKISAAVTLVGVGSTTASTTLATLNLVDGIVVPINAGLTSTTTIPSGDIQKTWSHSCSTSTCPFLYVEIWDNFTVPLGGPAKLYFNGTIWATGTGGSCTPASCNKSYTLANSTNTKVTPGSFDTVNAYSPGSTTTRWVSPGWWAAGVTVTLTMWLWVQWGTTAIGYAYATFTGTALT